MANYIQPLDNVCLRCNNERKVNEFGYCSPCMEKPGKKYDVSEIVIHPKGYADKHRPRWHRSK